MRRIAFLAAVVAMVGGGVVGAEDDEIRDLILQLRSRIDGDRIEACRALGRMTSRALPAAPHLARLVATHRDEKTRKAAALALRRIGPGAVGSAVELLGDKDAQAVAVAEDLLRSWSDSLDAGMLAPHVEALVKGLGRPEGREIAVELLRDRGGAAAIGPLAGLLDERDDATRAAAIEALGGAGKADVGAVVGVLESARRPRARTGAVEALGRMGAAGAVAVDALLGSLGGEDAETRVAAAVALGRIGDAPYRVVPALLPGLSATDPAFRDASIGAIAAFGGEALPRVVDLLVVPDAVVRDGAVEVLARIGTPAVPALAALLAMDDPSRRIAAAGAFAPLVRADPSPDCIQTLAGALKDGEARVVAAAARSLGQGGRFALAELGGLLAIAEEGSAEARPGALIGLGDALACHHVSFESSLLAEHGVDPEVVSKLCASVSGTVGPEVDDAARVARCAIDGPTTESLEGLVELAGSGRPGARDALERLGRFGHGARPVLEAVCAAAASEDVEVRRAAVRAVARIVHADGTGVRDRPARMRRLPKAVREAVDRGLAWLARHQDADGRWDCDGWMKHDETPGSGAGQPLYDQGVTGLAVLAMLATGEGDPWRSPAGRGLRWLCREQTRDGVYGPRQSQHFALNHAIATFAMAEGVLMLGDECWARSAALGVGYAERARNPDLAWRYAPRDGENDTHMTAWMVAALTTADQAGVPVDPAAYAGALRWVDTASAGGRVGYNQAGGSSARPEGFQEQFPPEVVEPMTAAGLWCFCMLGGGRRERRTLTEAILAKPPRWDRQKGTIDFCYWYFGANALHAAGEKGGGSWQDAVTAELLREQDDDGSWEPAGVWGVDGGRVYSTAVAVLTLLARVRCDPAALEEPRYDKDVREALTLLRTAEGDGDPIVATTAWRARNAIRGGRR